MVTVVTLMKTMIWHDQGSETVRQSCKAPKSRAPVKFCFLTYLAKLVEIFSYFSKNRIIIASTVLSQYTSLPYRQTDRDRRHIMTIANNVTFG